MSFSLSLYLSLFLSISLSLSLSLSLSCSLSLLLFLPFSLLLIDCCYSSYSLDEYLYDGLFTWDPWHWRHIDCGDHDIAYYRLEKKRKGKILFIVLFFHCLFWLSHSLLTWWEVYFFCLHLYPFIHLFTYLSIYLSIFLCTVYLSLPLHSLLFLSLSLPLFLNPSRPLSPPLSITHSLSHFRNHFLSTLLSYSFFSPLCHPLGHLYQLNMSDPTQSVKITSVPTTVTNGVSVLHFMYLNNSKVLIW